MHPVLGVADETHEIDVVLVKDVPLEVEIVDASTGRPVFSANLVVEMKVGGHTIWGAARVERRKAGRWLVHGLPRGEVVLRVEAPSYRTWREEIDPSGAGPCRIEMESVPGIDLHGIVRDQAGRPVPNVQVSGLGHKVRCSARATTDARGRFVLRGLAPDKIYEIGALTFFEKFVSQTVYFEPKPGQIIELTLEPAAGLKGRLRIDDGGDLPREVCFRVDNLRGPSGESLTATTSQKCFTVHGSSATFSVGSLPPGVYDVSLWSREFLPIRIRGIRLEAGKTTDLGEIHACRGGCVRLTLVDHDGRPVTPCTAVALDRSGVVWTYGHADTEGQVRLYRRLPAGKYQLVGVTAAVPAVNLGSVTVSGTQEVERRCVVREPGRMRVLLQDRNGAPRPGMSIEVHADDPGPMASILVCGLAHGVWWKAIAHSWGNGRDEHGNVVGTRNFRSDQQGVVDIGPLDPGNYIIEAGGKSAEYRWALARM